MVAEEIISFWGLENLKRWPRAEVDKIDIPGDSKSFLVETGLPSLKGDVTWPFLFDERATSLERLNHTSYVCIGFFYELPLYLDEGRNGCVLKLTEDSAPKQFVNSSVQSLGQFLVLYRKLQIDTRQWDGIDDEKCMEIIRATESKMKNMDQMAIGDADNLWSITLQEWKYDFMSDEELGI